MRQFLGAVGLLIVAIAGPLAVLSLVLDGEDPLLLLSWTGFGLIMWSQAIAPQAGLGYRVTMAWLIALVGLILGFIVAVGLLTAGLGVVLGSRERSEVRVAFAIATALAIASARWDPRRADALRALGHAAVARATAEDSRLLAAGPGVLLRPGRTLAEERTAGGGDRIADPPTPEDRLAAADASLTPDSSTPRDDS